MPACSSRSIAAAVLVPEGASPGFARCAAVSRARCCLKASGTRSAPPAGRGRHQSAQLAASAADHRFAAALGPGSSMDCGESAPDNSTSVPDPQLGADGELWSSSSCGSWPCRLPGCACSSDTTCTTGVAGRTCGLGECADRIGPPSAAGSADCALPSTSRPCPRASFPAAEDAEAASSGLGPRPVPAALSSASDAAPAGPAASPLLAAPRCKWASMAPRRGRKPAAASRIPTTATGSGY